MLLHWYIKTLCGGCIYTYHVVCRKSCHYLQSSFSICCSSYRGCNLYVAASRVIYWQSWFSSSWWIGRYAGADPEGRGGRTWRAPGAPPKIGKNMIFWRFLTRNTQTIFAPPSAQCNFFQYVPETSIGQFFSIKPIRNGI